MKQSQPQPPSRSEPIFVSSLICLFKGSLCRNKLVSKLGWWPKRSSDTMLIAMSVKCLLSCSYYSYLHLGIRLVLTLVRERIKIEINNKQQAHIFNEIRSKSYMLMLQHIVSLFRRRKKIKEYRRDPQLSIPRWESSPIEVELTANGWKQTL